MIISCDKYLVFCSDQNSKNNDKIDGEGADEVLVLEFDKGGFISSYRDFLWLLIMIPL